MCGRTFQRTPLGEIAMMFETVNPVPNTAPNYNAAPTDALPVVRLGRDGRRALDLLRWGLIPYWAKDLSIGPRCINAMAETVATKPAFREAFRRRRCLVPVDGFYEWQKPPTGAKQPYAVVAADGRPFAMAGLWERWTKPGSGETVQSFAIVTGPPNELVAPIHNRMPVILPREAWPAWLGERELPVDQLLRLLQPYPAAAMHAYKVGPRVGNVRNNDADLLAASRDQELLPLR
jgi:putative SOS response-associated peptidase YedK